ncbi:MAG: feruloyl-CoA synthase [Hyphomicrobiales bacterium]|nr:feruloyl-CoA synthase [Hyphomicrobiales bacterium]
MEVRADGARIVRNVYPLDPYPTKLTQRLEHWASVAPDRVWLAARENGQWRRITYAQALASVRRIASAILARGLSAERPLMILSGNDLDHALLGMGAMYAGCAYAPISPAYSLVSSDHGKLKYIIELMTPGMIFVADGAPFARAIENAVPADVELVVGKNPPAGRPSTPFSDLLATAETPAVDAAHEAVGPGTIAKFLFTSGSTGMPKAVINTQLMLCSNMAMTSAHFAFMQETPPVTLDWSPWNHTAGGNHDFNLFLYHGGTFHLDDGKPTPGGMEATVRNLHDVSPTWYFNVPKGYAALVPYLRDDEALRRSFFKNLKMMWYAGAGMAQHVWDALDELSVQTTGERVYVLTGLGSTETAPFALAANQTMVGAGNVGVPARGVEMKLVDSDGKWEARVRGPNITPGYWRQPDLTAKAFDEEGFYKLGDALRFVDDNDVNRGFLFDGRIAEDFKLNTGTWVLVGPLRAAFIDHCAPYVHDVVIAGIDQDYIGALVFPDLDACRALAGEPALSAPEAVAHPLVRARFDELLQSFSRKSTGSSTRIARAILLQDGPSIDKSEMTDKGSINQRAVLGNRAPLVQALYAQEPAPSVLCVDAKR